LGARPRVEGRGWIGNLSGRDQAMGKVAAFPAEPRNMTAPQTKKYAALKKEWTSADRTITNRRRELRADDLRADRRQRQEIDKATAEQEILDIIAKAKAFVADVNADVPWGYRIG
jgi:hypothetical protein